MYCKACGKSIAVDSLFCQHCGKRQNDVSYAEGQAQHYEICEIQINNIKGSNWLGELLYKMEANVIAPGQRRLLYSSTEFRLHPLTVQDPDRGHFPKDSRFVRDLLNQMVSKLTANGWEPSGTVGPEWYRYRFHRLLK